MNKNIFKKVGIGIVLGLALLPFLVLAAEGPGGMVPGTGLITNPNDITYLVSKILGWVGGIVLTLALIMLLYAAILYLTAGASETAHGKAKGVLIYAIVGIVVALLAFSVRPFLETVLRGRF